MSDDFSDLLDPFYAAPCALWDSERAKQHEQAVSRAHDYAVCKVAESSALVRAATEAVCDFANRTLAKQSETEIYPSEHMRAQRESKVIRKDELYQDTYTLKYATATSRNISTAVGAMMGCGADVRMMATAVPRFETVVYAKHGPKAARISFSLSSSHIYSSIFLLDSYQTWLQSPPFLQPLQRPVEFKSSYERYNEDMEDLDEMLRICAHLMQNATDKHYLAEPMRAMGQVAEDLRQSLATTKESARASIKTIREMQKQEGRARHDVKRRSDWELAMDAKGDFLVAHSKRVREVSSQVMHMADKTLAVLEIEADATQHYWMAAKKHFRNVCRASGTGFGHRWLFSSFWERVLHCPRYKALKRAEELLKEAWVAELAAHEALDKLAKEVFYAKMDTDSVPF
ncbi:hypothetical protein SBRCBS47491_006387 [Sporothrix bragantina]|uniref:Uncharacterized protein n=1 Tax=Sporothrix bragantina TaxID=671064 RepID=A0ABP0C5I4_9PEZI